MPCAPRGGSLPNAHCAEGSFASVVRAAFRARRGDVAMKEVIDIGLPVPGQPFSWATKAAGLLFTAHGPVRRDGSVDTGDIAQQARLTLENLRMAAEAAGADLSCVEQVLVTLVDAGDG